MHCIYKNVRVHALQTSIFLVSSLYQPNFYHSALSVPAWSLHIIHCNTSKLIKAMSAPWATCIPALAITYVVGAKSLKLGHAYIVYGLSVQQLKCAIVWTMYTTTLSRQQCVWQQDWSSRVSSKSRLQCKHVQQCYFCCQQWIKISCSHARSSFSSSSSSAVLFPSLSHSLSPEPPTCSSPRSLPLKHSSSSSLSTLLEKLLCVALLSLQDCDSVFPLLLNYE